MSVAQTSIVESLFAPCSTAKFLHDYSSDKPCGTHGSLAGLPGYLHCEALSSCAGPAARISFGNATAANGVAVANDVPTALLRHVPRSAAARPS